MSFPLKIQPYSSKRPTSHQVVVVEEMGEDRTISLENRGVVEEVVLRVQFPVTECPTTSVTKTTTNPTRPGTTVEPRNSLNSSSNTVITIITEVVVGPHGTEAIAQ